MKESNYEKMWQKLAELAREAAAQLPEPKFKVGDHIIATMNGIPYEGVITVVDWGICGEDGYSYDIKEPSGSWIKHIPEDIIKSA